MCELGFLTVFRWILFQIVRDASWRVSVYKSFLVFLFEMIIKCKFDEIGLRLRGHPEYLLSSFVVHMIVHCVSEETLTASLYLLVVNDGLIANFSTDGMILPQ